MQDEMTPDPGMEMEAAPAEGEVAEESAVEVVVAGDPDDPATRALLAEVERLLALAEPIELLVLADVQPVLHQGDAVGAELLLELVDLLEGAPDLVAAREALDPLHEDPAVPAAVEDGRPPGARDVFQLAFPEIRQDTWLGRVHRYRGDATSDFQSTPSWNWSPRETWMILDSMNTCRGRRSNSANRSISRPSCTNGGAFEEETRSRTG